MHSPAAVSAASLKIGLAPAIHGEYEFMARSDTMITRDNAVYFKMIP